jgi:hypothetical protein
VFRQVSESGVMVGSVSGERGSRVVVLSKGMSLVGILPFGAYPAIRWGGQL